MKPHFQLHTEFYNGRQLWWVDLGVAGINSGKERCSGRAIREVSNSVGRSVLWDRSIQLQAQRRALNGAAKP